MKKISKTTNTNFNLSDVKDGNFVVIAHCSDGDVILSKDGEYEFEDLEQALEVMFDHTGLGNPHLTVYMVQHGRDEYYNLIIELIRTAEANTEEYALIVPFQSPHQA